ncbi:protein BTG3 isoform X2 [Brienomyrus brachyistius]|uniref:protein BTG3 isoform X2 n=1 Tax=Brienomyrus brachyistius TaxID=42636 RepID=UPI0020B3A5D0|nr:protein BTG3 isoform X2 [Brienomyrus brachyistius]
MVTATAGGSDLYFDQVHTALNMRKEIAAVVFFLKRLIRKAEKLKAEQVEKFVERLTVALQEKYRGHWYPDNPSKGQAFRCIRVNKFQREDPELQRACEESGVLYKDLGLPRELTLWVDPGEVCCRYGEMNLAFTVASFSGDDDNKEDVTKEVTSAVERVTSDYHSGSSSDEENSTRDISATAPLVQGRPLYQVVYPVVPMWHPSPRRKPGPSKGQGLHHHAYGFRSHGKPMASFRQSTWALTGPRGVNSYWGSTPNLVHS